MARRTQSKLSELNLSATYITSLRVFSIIDPPGEADTEPVRFPTEHATERGVYATYATYTPRSNPKNRHWVAALVSAPNEEVPVYSLNVAYSIEDLPPQALIHRTPRPPELFKFLEGWNFEDFCIASVDFEYPSDVARSLAISLPGRMERTDGLPGVLELEGIRGSLFPSDDAEIPDCTFTLQRLNGGNLFLALQFPIEETFSVSTPRRAVSRAKELAGKLVEMSEDSAS